MYIDPFFFFLVGCSIENDSSAVCSLIYFPLLLKGWNSLLKIFLIVLVNDTEFVHCLLKPK